MKEEKKRMAKKTRKQMYRTVLLSLLWLLFELLWKIVIYWVDPAAFVQQSLQAGILPGSDDIFQ